MNKGWIFVLSICFAVLTAVPSLAGFAQKERDGGMILMEKARIKVVPAEKRAPWFIADMKNDRVIMGDPAAKHFASGSSGEYCAMMQQMFEAMAAFMGGSEKQDPGAAEVKVVEDGPGGVIAGFDTVKYKVYAGGQLLEEVWLSNDASLMKALGNLKNTDFMACTADHPALAASSAYADLQGKGWALKRTIYEDGEAYVDTDVISMRKKSIPDAEFEAPAAYKQISFPELFEMYR